jgi:hydroxylaminobenzene mutase
MFADSLSRELLIHGTVLFLLGLVNGLVVQRFLNPRMGLSSHLVAVQNGLVLWVLGLIWPQLRLTPPAQSLTAWCAIVGLYAIWLGLLLAGIWGASRATPIAGAGHSTTRGKERIVALLIIVGSLAILVATVLVLYGLF